MPAGVAAAPGGPTQRTGTTSLQGSTTTPPGGADHRGGLVGGAQTVLLRSGLMSAGASGSTWWCLSVRGCWGLAALVVLCLVGCGRTLPHYAEPQGQSVDPKELEGRELIAYRTLTASDFRAPEPPEEMRPYAERMGAVTCANLLTSPKPEYYVERTESGFAGAYIRLGFVARMDRNCSWWNPAGGPIPHSYVLQHEQIHFAIAEIAARQLNRRAQALVDKPITRNSEEQLHKELNGLVEELMDEAVKELVRRNRKFDQETSNTYAPELQQRWYDRVMAEL